MEVNRIFTLIEDIFRRNSRLAIRNQLKALNETFALLYPKFIDILSTSALTKPAATKGKVTASSSAKAAPEAVLADGNKAEINLEEADWQEEDLSSSQPLQTGQSQLPESLFLHNESDEPMVSPSPYLLSPLNYCDLMLLSMTID